MSKGGRPRGSELIDSSYSNKKEYNKEYRKQYRYIFSVNLSQDKDGDIIEALESSGRNRQAALKDLIRAGIKFRGLKDTKFIPLDPDSRGYTETFTCKNCRARITVYCSQKYLEYDFCPYCGAKEIFEDTES